LKTHLKGKKLDLAQLGKVIVDAARKPSKVSPPPSGKKAKQKVWRKKRR